MIEGIIEWSIRNRYLVILASIALAVAGFRALLTMPMDAIPDQSENQVIVFTDWMGRNPKEIEDQVTFPLSVNLQGRAGVKVVRSSSRFNISTITIIFTDETDYHFARQRVQEKLAIATTFLPRACRGSALSPAVCRACAEAYDACVAGCGKHQADQCERCAEGCRRCSMECRKMAA